MNEIVDSSRLAAIPTGGATAVSPGRDGRVVSLDQFRGYTILGMILVNFLGGFAVIPSVFKHNNNYFSYADSIMPSFHFAVGYAYRLTLLKRLNQIGPRAAYLSYVRRSFILIFLALALFGLGDGFSKWSQFSTMPQGWTASSPTTFTTTFFAQWRSYLVHLLKSDMWNTFAIIGATQLVVLPFVAARARVRLLALAGFALGHALLCYWFNWGFVRGDATNWMEQLWGTGDDRSWDGGFFGPLCWAVPMLAGTLAYDVMRQSDRTGQAARRLLAWGCGAMLIGYLLSCPTRLFDVDRGAVPNPQRQGEAQDPFFSSPAARANRPLSSLLAEPPFVAPPDSSRRLENYWMMSKRIPTLSFILFATGFACALYGVFVAACDLGSWRLGVLGTFGMNPLAAYCLHEIIQESLRHLVPEDAPLWYCSLGLVAFFWATYACVRALEKSRIFIRL
ncbi:MAG TPA: hypothetical protein VGO67_12320 [Verrucomicrobiae bacterium]|jgi:predicted acyltransferase